MTDFYAMYLFMIFAWLFLILSLWFRYWILYIASGFCWGMDALYTITHAHAGETFIWAYSIFCIAMAILMFFANWWLPKKYMDKNEYSQFSTFEDWETGQQKRNFAKSWGKPLTDAEKKQKEKDDRRARGEWVDDND